MEPRGSARRTGPGRDARPPSSHGERSGERGLGPGVSAPRTGAGARFPRVRGGQRAAAPGVSPRPLPGSQPGSGPPCPASPHPALPQRAVGSRGAMNRSRTGSTAKAATAALWGEWVLGCCGRVPRGEDYLEEGTSPLSLPALPGCELNQEKRTWTFKPQKEGKQDCKVLLSTVGVPARRGGGTATEEQREALVPPGATGVPLLPSGDAAPCLLSTLSDLLGGESQRGDEPRGDPVPRKPGGQEVEAHHHRLAAGLRPAHGKPFPVGLGALCGVA